MATAPPAGKTPVTLLQEIAMKCLVPYPTYNLIFSKTGTHENRFDYMVTVGDIEVIGSGSKKQIAKQRAAYIALQIIKCRGIYNFEGQCVNEYSNTDTISGNYIGPLQQKCKKEGIPQPEFVEILNDGPSQFIFECRLGSNVTRSRGYSTKAMAKNMAAYEMLKNFDEIIKTLKHETKDDDQSDQEMKRVIECITSMSVIDKNVRPGNFQALLTKRIKEKNLTYMDLKCYFDDACEETFQELLEKLDIEYKIQEIQQNPCIVEVMLKHEPKFTILGMNYNFQLAKAQAIKQSLIVLEGCLKKTLENLSPNAEI